MGIYLHLLHKSEKKIHFIWILRISTSDRKNRFPITKKEGGKGGMCNKKEMEQRITGKKKVPYTDTGPNSW